MRNSQEQPVAAYHNGMLIGEYESIAQAAKKLFIRRSTTIWKHIFLSTGVRTVKSRGVKSYKTGLKYTFEKA